MTETRNGFFVCILRCADGTYHVGATSDLFDRVETHNSGRGPRFTACRRPVVFAYSESFPTTEQARHREIQLKNWSRAKKEALIAENLDALHNLSRRQSR
jgi:predicted GIY-YIG superfamily endonuclease